jgi:uncharacterized protein (TIGR01777 family)
MSTILITGGTGLVGKRLTHHLIAEGHNVIILTRKIPNTIPAQGVQYALWNVAEQTIDEIAVQKAQYIIHLAGAGVVDKFWTDAYKNEIIQSRTQSSALLIKAIEKQNHQLKAVISASAIGWYGADPRHIENGWKGFTENTLPDESFLGNTCKQWEDSIEPVTQWGIRLAKLRIGIVLSNDGGALAEFKKPLKFGVAGIIGSGQQMVSWVHIDDLCKLFLHAIKNEVLQGSYNAVAPEPVSNKTLTLTLAKAMKGKWFLPMHVPPFALKILMGESSIEVLKSTTVSSRKIEQTGFVFQYPTIESAIQQLIP